MTIGTNTNPCCDPDCEPASNSPALSEGERDRQLAIFKALADGTRFDVFRVIAAQETAICVCDVVEQFGVSQPTISHHLKVLRDAGLITVSRRGVWAYYAVDPRGLAVLQSLVTSLAPAPVAVAS